MPGSPTSTTPSCGSGCTGSPCRPCSCGARTIDSSPPRTTATRSGRPFRARGSRRSIGPATSRTSKSRRPSSSASADSSASERRRTVVAMRAWFFSENAYHLLPDSKEYDSIRVKLPNRYYDPKIGADLYHRFIDEWQIAEDLGLEIMVNEHHQTATNLNPSAAVVMGALARDTRKARLLILGNPIANRREPVRVAEEMAMVDVYSRGRLECGFVRGVPYEMSAGNHRPTRMMDRFWEAHDLIVKAWTSHDGPFNWEGKYFHHRQVNIWPRPYQEPHPPIWITALSPSSALSVGEKGYIVACFLTGFEGTPDSVYRQIMKMYEHVGGFGHLLIMGQAGFLDHDETVKGMQMFVREVYPRLKALA